MALGQNGTAVDSHKKEKEIVENSQVSDAIESMTVHGFPRIFSSNRWLTKLFWFVAFSGALGTLIWLIYLRVTDYKRHEVYVKADSKVLQPLPFPAVTICNSDRFSGTPIKQFSFQNRSCSQTTTNQSLTREDIEFKKACKTFLSGYKDTFRFGGEDLPGFPELFTSSNGIYPCFTFNKNGQAKQNVSGGGKGLDMILFNDPKDIYDSGAIRMSRFDDQRRGILMNIHDPAAEVSSDQSSGIILLPGHLTEVVIKRSIISRKKKPFPSKCQTSETNKYKLIGGRYTLSNCLFSCFQMKLRERCGDIMKVNKSVNQMKCEADMYRRQPIEDCECEQPCYEVTFPRVVSVSVWPRRFQLESIRKEFSNSKYITGNMTLEYLQKRFTQVKLYYQDLIETQLSEEELYGITNLLSEIGGLMGLLIGSSVISIVEITWLSGIVTKKAFDSICSRNKQEPAVANTMKNIDIIVYNRTDNLVNATAGQVDYKELVDSPALGYSRKTEQHV